MACMPLLRRSVVSLLRSFLALGMLTGVAACAHETTGPPVLQLATWFGANEAREFAPILAAVNKRHAAEFKVELVTIPGNYQTKVDTMMAGRLAPDMFLLSQEFLPSYASVGSLVDLDERIKADKSIDLADYYPAAIESSRFKGHFYGLPWVMTPLIFYYNKKLFDDVKQAYPTRDWDWATFREAAKRLTKIDPGGRATQWGFLQYDWPPYLIWVWQNGGDVLTNEGKPTFDRPETIEALDFMRQLVVVDKVSPTGGTVTQMGPNELFKSGRVAMFFGGATDDFDRMPGMSVGDQELPHGKQRATFAYMAHLVISSQTKHADLAYIAWRDLLEGFHHWKIVPPRRSLAQAIDKLAPEKAAAKQVILNSMEYTHGMRGVVEQTDFNDFVLNTMTAPLLSGARSAPDAARQTQAKLVRLLETTP
jgi:multiple sugar transport system substrate-binding protein